MIERWKGVLILGAALAMPVRIWGQTQGVAGAGPAVAHGGAGLEAQKQRLDQDLQKRIADIEKRYAEEQGFRVKMKEGRLGFEKKLVQERKAFLDSIQSMDTEGRRAAWAEFFKKVREERETFNSARRAESKKFWEARALKRQAYGKPGPYGSAH